MRQYLDVKDRYPDGIVFFRLGDFYEMFFEDALIAAKALDLTLTTRDKGREDAVPMCGVPHHAARGYVAKLCELGHKVVICEQVEDPRVAKGIVKREVTRVVTPGIVLDEDMLDAKAPRYLAAVVVAEGDQRGLAYLDVTTGEFHATCVASSTALEGEIARVEPREIRWSRRRRWSTTGQRRLAQRGRTPLRRSRPRSPTSAERPARSCALLLRRRLPQERDLVARLARRRRRGRLRPRDQPGRLAPHRAPGRLSSRKTPWSSTRPPRPTSS